MSAMEPDAYGYLFTADLELASAGHERSRQVELGVSDIGSCRERTRRVIVQAPKTDKPSTAAADLGRWIH